MKRYLDNTSTGAALDDKVTGKPLQCLCFVFLPNEGCV